MITTQTSSSLAKSLRLDWHCHHRAPKTTGSANRPEQAPERIGGVTYTVGWRSRPALALRSREKFFLDIPSYRAHWPNGERNRDLSTVDQHLRFSKDRLRCV